MDSDFAAIQSREEARGGSDRQSHCEILIYSSELEFGLSSRSIYMDLGTPMNVEIQSDSSTANSLADRLGAGPRTKHIDTRYFLVQE